MFSNMLNRKKKMMFRENKILDESFLSNDFQHLIRTEAVIRRSSVKKVFIEILQNSQENTCARGLQLY